MRQNHKRMVLSEMALDFLLLALFLGGFLWSIRYAYGLEIALRPFLIRVLLPAMVVGWCLARLPKRRLFLVAFTALLAFAGWYWQNTWLSGGCQLLQQALTTLAVPVEVESQWLTGSVKDVLWTATYYALSASIILSITVLMFRSTALSWALTLPWLAPAVLFERELSWLGLLALTAGGCLLLLTGRSHRFDRAGSIRQAWLALPPLLVVLALVAALLPRQDYMRPQWTEAIRSELNEIGGSLNDDFWGRLGGMLPSGDQVSVSLSNAGPRSFREDVVLEVESEYHGTVYLRGTSAAVYTGEDWEDLPESIYDDGLGDDGMVNAVQGFSPLNFPALASSSLPYYEMTITYPKSLSGWMFTPYQLLSKPEEIADVTFIHDTHLERDFGIRTKNLYFIPPEEIQVLSRSTQWEAAVAEAEYRQFVYKNYLTLPEGFEATFQTFAHRFQQEYGDMGYSGEETLALLYAKMCATMLSMMTEYDLETPLTPEGKDFVDYFLNESQRGYCVHYASAGVLMMRYFGVPARYVTGYLTKVPASGKVEVLDSDAHAWVEIYLDGYGWYPVEMTPPAAIGLSEDEGIAEPEESIELDVELDELEPETAEQTPEQPQETKPETPDVPEEVPEEPEKDAAIGWSAPVWLLWVLAALAIASLFPLRSLVCARRRKQQFTDKNYSAAVLAMYRHLEQLRPWGTNPNILRPLAQKAQYSRQGLSEEEWRQAELLWQKEQEKIEQLSKTKRFWLRWILGHI